MSKYDFFIKVIKDLTVQRARSELFTMAMEIELCGHRQMQKLLTAVSLLLQQICMCLHDRMVSGLLHVANAAVSQPSFVHSCV